MSIEEYFDRDFYKEKDFLKAYEEPNYEIIETPDYPLSDDNNPENLKTCAVYFSSMGLYQRENIEDFRKMCVEKNRYEWKRNLIKTAQKHIFVRDIYMLWYVKGINSTINTQEKLIEFLKEQTKGYRVITLGTSAGGYMAAYAGIKLNACKIFSFCGQFLLRFGDARYDDGENVEKLIDTYKGNSLYFFTARDFVNDKPEYEFALRCDNIKTFLIKTDSHGIPFPVLALTNILNMPKSKLDELYEHYKSKEINIIDFSYKVKGIKFVIPIIKDFLRHTRKFLKNAFK